jgi:hypothetical protein
MLESDQHRYRCRPTHGPWREASRRRGWWEALCWRRLTWCRACGSAAVSGSA